jgi:hypothetical protein
MVNLNRFYTYAYLREDRTPYYIGKGSGRRINENKGRPCKKPKDKSKIIFLKQNLTEEEAFKHEIYMIAVFGRKDLGTGILYNKTNGGEGPSGYKFSEESKAGMSAARKGKPAHNKGKSPSKETRTKMSKSKKGKNHPFYGKKGKNSHNYGIKRTDETKEKLRLANLGEKNAFYGKTHSKETRTKMSESKKDIKWWNDGCGNTKMSVECPGPNWIRGRGKFEKKS